MSILSTKITITNKIININKYFDSCATVSRKTLHVFVQNIATPNVSIIFHITQIKSLFETFLHIPLSSIRLIFYLNEDQILKTSIILDRWRSIEIYQAAAPKSRSVNILSDNHFTDLLFSLPVRTDSSGEMVSHPWRFFFRSGKLDFGAPFLIRIYHETLKKLW